MNRFLNSFAEQFPDKSEKFAIFYHVGYYYNLEAIKETLTNANYINIWYGQLALNTTESSTLGWQCSDSCNKSDLNTEISNRTCLYLGRDDQIFFTLSLTVHSERWYLCDPNQSKMTIKHVVSPLQTVWMRRRYFNIEKCKDAKSLGIVVGTLTANDYLDGVKHLQVLASKRGIRTYLISVGKVNPSKLANFMDIDCFVIVGCPLNNIYTSREFYKPLLSVFEVEIALNPAWHELMPESYAVDFREILPGGKLYREYDETKLIENDVSLVTGTVRMMTTELQSADTNDDGLSTNKQLQERRNQELMLIGSSDSFQNRSWTGLEPNLGKTEPAKMKQGRSGIAIKYEDDEKTKD